MEKNKFLIEVSFEVANKIGGIYTVLKEKAPYIKQKFGDQYLVIGPFFRSKGFKEFNQLILPEEFLSPIEETEKFGINVYYGEWLIDGRPKGFLIDYENLLSNVNGIKYELWLKHQIDSLRTGPDYDHPITWAKAASIFLKNFCEHFQNYKIILHLHEWLAGPVILFEEFPQYVNTIFTTHATVLGRALAGSGINFWENIEKINPDEEAYKYQIEAKHLIEKKTAKKANYFTVISNILASEAERFLGRKPDAILPNGIDFSRSPTLEEIAQAHRKNREVLKEFVLFFFAPYYKVELKDSLFIFISGRHEIKNKGIDIFIKALGVLNKKLKDFERNIFAFLWIPGEVKDTNRELINNLNIYRSIEHKIDEMGSELKSRLLHYLIHKEEITGSGLFTEEEFLEFRRMFNQIRKSNNIPLSTHVIDDEIIYLLKEACLLNKKDDKVKVIYYPIYLSSTDGFLNLNYEEAVVGCHIGVFPSFYEPWGYTPLETAASGVLTITTDITGFADYLKNSLGAFEKESGIYIIKRKGKKDDEVIQELSFLLEYLVKIERIERVQNKIEARKLASLCDWSKLIKNYFELYESILR